MTDKTDCNCDQSIELKAQLEKVNQILVDNGICSDCGSHWIHHMNEPFASCKCKTGEDVHFSSPYMQLQKRTQSLERFFTLVFEEVLKGRMDKDELEQYVGIDPFYTNEFIRLVEQLTNEKRI